MIVRSLPARFGDCLLVTWGSPQRAMLIDAGLGKTYTESLRPALAQCKNLGIRRLELVVVTHIDRDHIGGIEQTLTLRHDHGLVVYTLVELAQGQQNNAPRSRSDLHPAPDLLIASAVLLLWVPAARRQ